MKLLTNDELMEDNRKARDELIQMELTIIYNENRLREIRRIMRHHRPWVINTRLCQ